MSLEHENLSVAWHLPQPSTALLRGTSTELVARRGLAIRMELETDEGVETWTLSFQGVRFFSVAYDGARGVDDLAAYDRLLDLGETPLLARVRAQLEARGERTAHGTSRSTPTTGPRTRSCASESRSKSRVDATELSPWNTN